MTQRYLSFDFLRGITIFGMVFCAIIPHGVLPGWMYHVQNPPPTHNLNMGVSGIGCKIRINGIKKGRKRRPYRP